jgi:hypothetical protein
LSDTTDSPGLFARRRTLAGSAAIRNAGRIRQQNAPRKIHSRYATFVIVVVLLRDKVRVDFPDIRASHWPPHHRRRMWPRNLAEPWTKMVKSSLVAGSGHRLNIPDFTMTIRRCSAYGARAPLDTCVPRNNGRARQMESDGLPVARPGRRPASALNRRAARYR